MWPSNEYGQSIEEYAQQIELNCPFVFDYTKYINEQDPTSLFTDFNRFKDNYSHRERPKFVKTTLINELKEKYPSKQEEYQLIETLD